ncbi:MAG: glycosyltransferase family 2 protein [Pseudomonadales bacterium]|nr:glycosyltransferase family 2 protein [Pseudomonadales bacterium]MDG1443375.1 glycosyltransferase family 2 protein [Pseudomonadales bacterium]
MKYSVVIPVFNSEGIVRNTVQRTVEFFEANNLLFEIIVVNDGSTDNSWSILNDLAKKDPRVKAINLLKNYGQHSANLCGFRYSSGDFLITIDDDLQNPPEEIIHLINKSKEGHDLVIGQFYEKRHALYRRIGSKLVTWMNSKVFGKPKDLMLSNFRLMNKDVVSRVCDYQTASPYIPGLVLMMSSAPANVLVEHHDRIKGQSNYSMIRILRLIATILFNHSSFPLRMVTGLGLAVSLFSLMLGAAYLVYGLMAESVVPGWTSLVVLLSFYNGVLMSMVGILGEYIVRILGQSNGHSPYHVKVVVDGDKIG